MTDAGRNKDVAGTVSGWPADWIVSWRKSSWSSYNGSCIEVAELQGSLVYMRDTKQHGTGPVLAFTRAEWNEFLSKVKSGKLNS